MAKAKKELTPEELFEKKRIATHNRRYAGFKRSLKSKCEGGNIGAMEFQLEYLKSHPNTPLPKKYFDHETTVSAWQEAVNEFKEEKSI